LSSTEPGTDATLAIEEYDDDDDDLAVARLAWLAHEDRTALDQACHRCLSYIEVDLSRGQSNGVMPISRSYRSAP
jgi:hypothetical protein